MIETLISLSEKNNNLHLSVCNDDIQYPNINFKRRIKSPGRWSSTRNCGDFRFKKVPKTNVFAFFTDVIFSDKNLLAIELSKGRKSGQMQSVG